MLKILQARLQQYLNHEIPDDQPGFRKGRGTGDQIATVLWPHPTSIGSSKKQVNSRKISAFASLTTLKPLTMWITTNCGKFLRRWESEYPVKKQQLEPDMKPQTGSKLGNKYIETVYRHLAYLTGLKIAG